MAPSSLGAGDGGRGRREGSLPPCPADPPVYECLVCRRFGSESLDALQRHLGARRWLAEAAWRESAGEAYHCRICRYRTGLRANFQLHLRTEKHAHNYQLAAHLASGGIPLPPGALHPGNPLHVRCNLCRFQTTSRQQLDLHVAGSWHQ
ncbi:hypothetical protein chiPu_0033121, partial [Chiloscyllium punctatum]|nr:hypothetical protein [Chiloscyllium punctatum]